jgi:hypothetical protein
VRHGKLHVIEGRYRHGNASAMNCEEMRREPMEIGAGDRDRTDDIQLGKLTFYH